MIVARRVLVSGRVQGVWFRESCRQEAEARGVAGWARNLSDGRVEVWLEGNVTEVEAVTAWCRHGPPRAEVVDVDIEAREPTGRAGFTVG